MKTKQGQRYAIDFNTKEMPGKIVAVTVALDTLVMGEKDTVRVDLCDHPLYPKLIEYVLKNPAGGSCRAVTK